MLKSALRPRSLAFLVVSLAVAALFVVLSMWQLNSSLSSATVADPAKDRVTPLREVLRPGQITTAQAADHVVTARGHYVPDSTRLVPNRLHDGQKGYWVIDQFSVAGSASQWDAAERDASIPVARGWLPDAHEVPAAPSGEQLVTGRLLPAEAPLPDHDLPEGQLPTVSPAQLTNEWNVPLYSGYLAAFAETPADNAVPVTADGTLAANASVASPQLRELQIDQQPTDRSVHALNLFYAAEWVIFAGFALFLWWRYVRDDYLRRQDPDEYFYLTGDYFWDPEARSFYYWDEEHRCYYYFDDQPAAHGADDE